MTKDRLGAVLKGIRELERHQVLVGVPAKTADRQPDPQDPGPINNATIGYLMETGSPAANIPARPHLQPGIEDARETIVAEYRTGADAVLDGKVSNADTIHTRVGLTAQASVRRKITDGPFEALAPATLADRKRRGRKGEKPLIDTGQYRQSINFVIRPKG